MSGILDHLSIGFGVALSWNNILVAAIGSFFGTMVGVLPGLGPVSYTHLDVYKRQKYMSFCSYLFPRGF